MSTIVTRAGKGSPLTNTELDSNFSNLNTDKAELSGSTFTGNLSLGDNVKAQFGSATDLSIYSDGTNSYIQEGSGTSGIRITTDNQFLIRKHDTENIAAFNVDGAVRFYHDNAQKFSTTSTGIDVTGSVTADGLTVEGATTPVIRLESETSFLNVNTAGKIEFYTNDASTNATGVGAEIVADSVSTLASVDLIFKTRNSAVSASTVERFKVASNGDISFYNDSAAQGLFFDSSTSRLGLGTTDPLERIQVNDGNIVLYNTGVSSSANASLGHISGRGRVGSTDPLARIEFLSDSIYYHGAIDFKVANDYAVGALSTKMRLTNTGLNVSGSVTSTGLTVDGNASVAGTTGVVVDTGTITTGKDSASSRTHWQMNNPNGQVAKWDSNGTDLLHYITDEYKLYTGGNKAFEIDGNGDISFYNSAGSSQNFYWDSSTSRLGLGVTNPSGTLDIGGQHILSDNYDAVGAVFRRNGTYGSVISLGRQGVSDGVTLDYPADNTFSVSTANTERLKVNVSGIDVTGSVVADGVQSTDGNIKVTTLGSFVGFNSQRAGVPSSGGYQLGRLNFDAYSTGTTFVSGASIQSYSDGAAWTSSSTPAYLSFQTTPSGSTSLKERIKVANNGDISFYDSSGSSQNLYWDSSTSRLGLGTTVPASTMHVNSGANGEILRVQGADAQLRINNATSNVMDINSSGSGDSLTLSTGDTAALTINSSQNATFSGSVTIPTIAYVGTSIVHNGDADTSIDFDTNLIDVYAGGVLGVRVQPTAVTINETGGDRDFRVESNGNTHMLFVDGGNNRVGVGTGSPSAKLDVQTGNAGSAIRLSATDGSSGASYKATTASGNFYAGIDTSSGGSFGAANSAVLWYDANQPMIFATSNSRKMTLTASGDLLVGKTNTTFSTSGIELRGSNGGSRFIRSNAEPILMNRTGSDGKVLGVYKDGVEKGNISVSAYGMGFGGGTRTSDFFLKTDGTASFAETVSAPSVGKNKIGLQFVTYSDSIGAIKPYSITNTTTSDDKIDLGESSARFDDIYATNGTIQTSDRNEKQDIESLTEAEERVAVACKGLLKKFRWKSAVQDKGDDARIHFGIIAQDLQAAFEAEGLDAGRYGMFTSNTWTEDGVEKTRMGVRYSELLAFIISAI